MAEIHYLFPRAARPATSGTPSAPSAPAPRRGVRVALAPTAFAALLTGETAGLGEPSPRLRRALEFFPSPPEAPRNRLDVGAPGGATPPASSDPGVLDRGIAEIAAPTSAGSWRTTGVRMGVPTLVATDGEALRATDARREALLALQRADAPVFAFRSESALAEAVAGVVADNRTPIEGWLRRGAQPALRCRLLRREAFGGVVHPGADDVSELRGLAVSVQLHEAPSRHVVIEFTL